MKVRMLEVNLSTGKIEKKELDNKYFAEWIGGRGLGAKLLSEEKIEEIEPLGENNVVFLSTSPLIGWGPSFNRIWVTTISPLTNYYLCSSAGGYFAGILRMAGLDVIKIKGKSKKPVFLKIENDEISLEDACDLWSHDTDFTREKLHKLGNFQVACIGQAGENLVKYACLQFEERSAGRGGVGAVFGSKNLKAIIVNGNQNFPADEPDKAKKISEIMTKKILETQTSWGKMGTLELSEICNEADIFPTSNWRKAHFDKGKDIYFDKFEKYIVKRVSCFKCPVPCAKHMKHKSGKVEDGPEYETIWAFGPQIDNNSPELIIEANRLCDKYGLDTINTGSIIGWLKECSEKGFIDYSFTNSEQVLELIGDIALREGELQKKLGEGLREIASDFGEEAEKIAIHQQNMCLPAYDPRGVWGMLLTYTLGPRHGCHLKAWTVSTELKTSLDERTSIKDKAKLVNDIMINRSAFTDSVSHCSFIDYDDNDIADLLSYVIEPNYTPNNMREMGSKLIDLERHLDVRRGLTKENDILPFRIIEEEVEVQGKKVKVGKENFEKMKQEFYKIRGW